MAVAVDPSWYRLGARSYVGGLAATFLGFSIGSLAAAAFGASVTLFGFELMRLDVGERRFGRVGAVALVGLVVSTLGVLFVEPSSGPSQIQRDPCAALLLADSEHPAFADAWRVNGCGLRPIRRIGS